MNKVKVYAASEHYYTDSELSNMSKLGGQDKEIAAIAYNYGVSAEKAKSKYETISDEDLERCLVAFEVRNEPLKTKLEYYEKYLRS